MVANSDKLVIPRSRKNIQVSSTNTTHTFPPKTEYTDCGPVYVVWIILLVHSVCKHPRMHPEKQKEKNTHMEYAEKSQCQCQE